MQATILRDPDAARQYLLQGLWLQKAVYPHPTTVTNALTWSLMIADSGQPLPPTGFVADLGHIALGKERDIRTHKEVLVVPGWPARLARTYDDHVLGKLYADWAFERASDALKRIDVQKQPLGLAYVVRQIRERGDFGGVELSPGIIRGLLTGAKPEENLRLGWESLNQTGPMPLLIELYDQIVVGARRMAEFLAMEDIIALEHQTALLSMGEYVAHRQVLQMAARLEGELPRHKIRPSGELREVPTRVLDEDTYPVGGFASISNRGSIESLLHSQLAYMEPEKEQRPDLFDVKYLRDELYYYSRDENQFLRRRRTFLFILRPDLVHARFKDPDLPCQRLVLVLALVLALVRKLSEWLSVDALHFEFLVLQVGDKNPLAEETKLLNLLFREQIENGAVRVECLPENELEKKINHHTRRSLCRGLFVSAERPNIRSDQAAVIELQVNGPRPVLYMINEMPPEAEMEAEEPFDCWAQALLRVLQEWL